MKLLACIPARGGSKRIPHKNVVDFHGKPLISYSIEAAKKSQLFSEVMVSTDDIEIARVSEEYGAIVPFMRDASLADDFTGTFTVTRDAFLKMQEKGYDYDGICCIYATAPLLTPDYLIKAFTYLKPGVDCVMSVCEFTFPIQRAFIMDKTGAVKYREPQYASSRSQDLEKCYHDCGQFYFYTKEAVLENKTHVTRPFIVPTYRVMDIDTKEDLAYAKVMYKILMEMHLE